LADEEDEENDDNDEDEFMDEIEDDDVFLEQYMCLLISRRNKTRTVCGLARNGS